MNSSFVRRSFFAVLIAALPLAAVAQHAAPSPGGSRTRSGGSSSDVNVNPATAMQQPPAVGNKGAMLHALHARIQNFIRTQHYDEAEAASMDLLQRDASSGQYVQLYMRQIQVGRNNLEAPLRALIIPSVELRDANFQDVIKFLSDTSVQLTNGKNPISFILQVPPGVTVPSVSLTLRQVPMLDVLRYTTSSAGLSYRIEQHAVVVYKAAPPAPKVVAPADGTVPNQ